MNIEPSKFSVIIVDDNDNMRGTLSDILSDEGYSVTCASSISEAGEYFERNSYDVVLADLKLPDGTGLDVLKTVKGQHKDTEVIIFTGYASLDTSISAIKAGAFSYLKKPVDINELKTVIAKAAGARKTRSENKALVRKLKALSLKDSHTGLYNHRYLMERLTKEIVRSKRYCAPVSVLMIDVDYFKSINDVYGHQFGDVLLKKLGEFLLKAVRENDVVVRYGGEEFVIIMPDTQRSDGAVAAERIQRAIRSKIFDPKKRKVTVKLSMGLAGFPEDGADNPKKLIHLADMAMRSAKRAGGDSVSVSGRSGGDDIENMFASRGKDNLARIREKVSKITERADGVVLESIRALARTVEARDHYEAQHAKDTVAIVTQLGAELNLSAKKIKELEHAAILHDIGKLGVPDRVLQKKGALTPEEFEKIKKHPRIGADLISSVRCLDEVVPMVLHHHERFDGKGYPDGLIGENIPIGARILAVADVYQALTSDRPYRPAFPKKEAVSMVTGGSGTQFDPRIVKIFLKLIRAGKI